VRRREAWMEEMRPRTFLRVKVTSRVTPKKFVVSDLDTR